MREVSQPSITNLPEQLDALPEQARRRFEGIFQVVRSHGSLNPPPEMSGWIERSFVSVEAVRSQAVIKTLNLWTLDGALFNSLRAQRPIQGRPDDEDLRGDGTDPFCHPLTGTPEDTFGRVRGRHSITASNVAKYDALHSVIILEHHHPLEWSREQVVDAFNTAMRWIGQAHRECPAALYPLVMWNCRPRSGASIVHAHLQAALSEVAPYARVELWRRAAQAYRERHGRGYFDDLYAAHKSVGLGGQRGDIRWLAHLTPVKEKEVVLLARDAGAELYGQVYELLSLLVRELGVRAYNVAMYLPPMRPVDTDWSDFPVVVRMVDRGDPASATSDIGAMELFAQPVVAFDPWKLASVVKGGG